MRACIYNAEHFESETVNVIFGSVSPSTDAPHKVGEYIAIFTNSSFLVQRKDKLVECEYATPTYVWNVDDATQTGTCTATMKCIYNVEHTETETVNVVYADLVEPNPSNPKLVGTYTATFTNSAFAVQTRDLVDELTINVDPVVEQYKELVIVASSLSADRIEYKVIQPFGLGTITSSTVVFLSSTISSASDSSTVSF